MIRNQSYYSDLLEQFIDNSLPVEGVEELLEWVKNNPEEYNELMNNDLVHDRLINYGENWELSEEKTVLMRNRLLKAINKHQELTPRVHRVHFLKTAWFKYAAAILLIIGVGTYLWNNNKTTEKKTASAEAPGAKVDALPGGNKALLVLGDESVINLDTVAEGQIAKQGSSDVLKLANGEIIYTGAGTGKGEVFYQKLITPRGGQYQVTLSDGTQVWLNAASSIRFPNIFTGATREVEVTGEVYFEVRTNAKVPFIVKTGNEQVTVLGTSFNINSYKDEPGKISLVEGSVKVNTVILKPGEAYTNGKIITTNVDQDIAWKNGFFSFTDANIKSV
ncbi:MAG: FecR domain-containing protein, partial [Chitinophagaceae bacterium]|nr:FecR domain-containing protein [Chitinophagaceae bacterium]